MRKFIGGAVLVCGLVVWEALNYWSVLDSVFARLDRSGPTGKLVVAVVTARGITFILTLVALAFVIEGIREIRKQRKSETNHNSALPIGPAYHTTIAPVISPVFENKPVATIAPLVRPPISKVEPPKHRVCYMGPPQIVNLKSTGYDFDIKYTQETANETGIQGVIVIFRNDSDIQKVRTIHGATAQLKFFDKNNKEIGSGVSGAYWLKDYNSPEFDLIPGGNAGRLLVLIRNGSKFAIPYEQGRSMHVEEFKSCPVYIEVNILDWERKKVCPVTISVKLEGRILKAETEHVS